MKLFKRPAFLIFISISLVISIYSFYVHANNKKIRTLYQDTLSESCSFALSGLTSIYTSVTSNEMQYSRQLIETRAAQDKLETAGRILDSGIQEIKSSGLRTDGDFILYSLNADSLKRLVDDTIADSIDIAIAQGDPESLQDGSAEEGLGIIQRRITYLNEICNAS
jgi:hypothetical protein